MELIYNALPNIDSRALLGHDLVNRRRSILANLNAMTMAVLSSVEYRRCESLHRAHSKISSIQIQC